MTVSTKAPTEKLAKMLTVSLITLVSSGAISTSSETLASELPPEFASSEKALRNVQIAAENGDAEAMYWLAMLHIEGSISSANYDRGIELLKASANRGNKNAERMYAFMGNAFSGEGC